MQVAAQKEVQTELKLISFNLRYDNPNDGENAWANRSSRVKAFFIEENADILGLQEALYNQVVELDDYLSTQTKSTYLRIGVGREDGKTKGEFSPIYFKSDRFNLISQDYFWLSQTPHLPSKGWDAACERIATVALLFDTRALDTLAVINSHWDHIGKEARKHSAEMISNYLSSFSKNIQVFVMGDFNASPEDASIALLRENLHDSCPKKMEHAGTYNGFNHDMENKPRIDYVLYRGADFRPTKYDIAQDAGDKSIYVSDHYAVISCFEKSQKEFDVRCAFLFQGQPIENVSGMSVSVLKMYVGNIELFNAQSALIGLDKTYRLLDLNEPASLQFPLFANDYPNKLQLTLGVDSVTNSAGVHGGDLDPTKGMYWSWQSGYIQFKFEGTYHGHSYSLHLGGFETSVFSTREHLSLIAPLIQTSLFNTQGGTRLPMTYLNIDLKYLIDKAESTGQFKLMSPNTLTPQFVDAIEQGISIQRVL